MILKIRRKNVNGSNDSNKQCSYGIGSNGLMYRRLESLSSYICASEYQNSTPELLENEEPNCSRGNV